MYVSNILSIFDSFSIPILEFFEYLFYFFSHSLILILALIHSTSPSDATTRHAEKLAKLAQL